VEALTKTGDPSAVQTLQFIDSMFAPADPVAKPRPTGYF